MGAYQFRVWLQVQSLSEHLSTIQQELDVIDTHSEEVEALQKSADDCQVSSDSKSCNACSLHSDYITVIRLHTLSRSSMVAAWGTNLTSTQSQSISPCREV